MNTLVKDANITNLLQITFKKIIKTRHKTTTVSSPCQSPIFEVNKKETFFF